MKMPKAGVLAGCAAFALGLSGCSALPESGPSTSAVTAAAGDPASQNATFAMININGDVARLASQHLPPTLFRTFTDHRGSVDPRIGVGDQLVVTIWESGPGGLFSSPVLPGVPSSGASSVTLPPQVVGRDGRISVPYAGTIPVLGRTPLQIQGEIVGALRGKAIQPQALVTRPVQASSTVTITGDAVGNAVLPLSPKGQRLLDVIAQAGGIRGIAADAMVKLSRGGHTEKVRFNHIVNDPHQNVYVRPNDIVTVNRDPRVFIALGATGANAQVPFDADSLSLSDALGKIYGLQDQRSDARGVFLFRRVPYSVARVLLPGSPLVAPGRLTPIVFRLNMDKPDSLFVAQNFPVFNHDVLYVSNAPFVDVQKVVGVFNSLSSPVATTAGLKTALK
ncbi:MAG: polysaccharide export protein [Hyphomicrobiales bacterium]|nr:polysaccharide export protein [Hyphomicrobiales bacterium]